jgi:hypothetical protein
LRLVGPSGNLSRSDIRLETHRQVLLFHISSPWLHQLTLTRRRTAIQVRPAKQNAESATMDRKINFQWREIKTKIELEIRMENGV